MSSAPETKPESSVLDTWPFSVIVPSVIEAWIDELCSSTLAPELSDFDTSYDTTKSLLTVYETEWLILAGLSNMASLLSVTKEAAKSLDIDDLVGTIEIGKEADLLVLNSNPLEDISNLWDVKDVFLAGRYIDRGSEKSLKSIRQLRPSLN